MTRASVVRTVLVVTGALAILWLVEAVIFGGARGGVRGPYVAVGLGFGLLLGLTVTRVTRQVAGAAAALLLGLALLDWSVQWPFGLGVWWLSASTHTWIAIAALAVRALVPPRASESGTWKFEDYKA